MFASINFPLQFFYQQSLHHPFYPLHFPPHHFFLSSPPLLPSSSPVLLSLASLAQPKTPVQAWRTASCGWTSGASDTAGCSTSPGREREGCRES